MNRPGSIFWFDRPLLIALALTAVMYVVTVLVGGVQGEYIPQPAVLAIVLGALLARWRLGLGWSMAIIGMLSIATILFILAEASLYPDGVPTIDHPEVISQGLASFDPRSSCTWSRCCSQPGWRRSWRSGSPTVGQRR